MNTFLEAVIVSSDELHARYPGAKLDLCGADHAKIKPSGTAVGRVSCEPCKKAWEIAAKAGEFSEAQKAPPEPAPE